MWLRNEFWKATTLVVVVVEEEEDYLLQPSQKGGLSSLAVLKIAQQNPATSIRDFKGSLTGIGLVAASKKRDTDEG